MDADDIGARCHRTGSGSRDLVENRRPDVDVRSQQAVHVGRRHAVGHRVQIRRGAAHHVGEAAVPAVFRERSIEVDFAARRSILDRHQVALEEVGPPVRPARRVDVQRTPEIDADGGGAVRLRVHERAEDRVELREQPVEPTTDILRSVLPRVAAPSSCRATSGSGSRPRSQLRTARPTDGFSRSGGGVLLSDRYHSTR